MLDYSTTLNQKLKKFLGRIKMIFGENSIHSDNPLNFKRSLCKKKLRGDNLIYRFFQGIWLNAQMEDGANTSGVWSPKRNCHSYNDNI